jgi:hypothetical protein
MLLKNTSVNLPILNTELSITRFYILAPYIYLLLHFNLLLQLYLLSNKLHRFNETVLTLKDSKTREHFRTRLFPFAFSHSLSGQQHSWFLRLLLAAMVWITIIWLPLYLLISLQVEFLAFRSEEILHLQHWAIAIDLFLITVFWPIIRSPNGRWLTWVISATGIPLILSMVRDNLAKCKIKQSRIAHALTLQNHKTTSGKPLIEGGLSLITLMTVIIFSWGIAILPNSDSEKHTVKWISRTSNWLANQTNREIEVISKQFQVMDLRYADLQGMNLTRLCHN